MFDFSVLMAVFGSIGLLLFLILRLRIPAFLSLLIASIALGVFAGVPANEVVAALQNGMGGTLGFVAIVVGLGTLLGGLLEHSGGANVLAIRLLQIFGEKNASWALVCTGFILAIPVFFDVAFILLIPLIYSLQRKTGKSILFYGLPLLAGLAITHAFIPPTPGPVAVAEILSANLGWVILFGFLVGFPTAMVSGPLFSNFISKKIHAHAPPLLDKEMTTDAESIFSHVVAVIGLPLLLIIFTTVMNSFNWTQLFPQHLVYAFQLIGHPFGALLIANLLAWYILGVKRGISQKALQRLANHSMGPAGLIILLTGAGGMFKQMLATTFAGEMIAKILFEQGVPVLFFAFFAAVIIRLLQGSATVAMITAAGLSAPLVTLDWTEPQKALLVLAIASGASILSHVNDSGFWLVSQYLGLNEQQTFRSWSIMTLLIALVGFSSVCLLWFFT